MCKWHARSPWNYKGYHIYKSYKPLISSFADEAATKESAETAEVMSPTSPSKLQRIPTEGPSFDSVFHNYAKTVVQKDDSKRCVKLQQAPVPKNQLPIWKRAKICFQDLVIILRGKFEIWAKDKSGQKDILTHTLTTGDAFGYSDFLQVMVSLQYVYFSRDLSI